MEVAGEEVLKRNRWRDNAGVEVGSGSIAVSAAAMCACGVCGEER